MGVPVIERSYKASSGGAVSTTTVASVQVNSGEALIVRITCRDGGTTVSNVKFNGTESLTKAVGLSGNLLSDIWYLPNPTATTANVVVTYNASRDRPRLVSVEVVSGADTSALIDATTTADNFTTSTSITANLTTTVNDTLLLDACIQVADATDPTFTPGTSQTAQINERVLGTFGGKMGHSSKSGGTAGSKTMSWTSSQNAQIQSVAIAITPGASNNALFAFGGM